MKNSSAKLKAKHGFHVVAILLFYILQKNTSVSAYKNVPFTVSLRAGAVCDVAAGRQVL
jgi:hypothetical protein